MTHRDYTKLSEEELNTIGQNVADGLMGSSPEDVADEQDIDAAIADGDQVASQLKDQVGEYVAETEFLEAMIGSSDSDDDDDDDDTDF